MIRLRDIDVRFSRQSPSALAIDTLDIEQGQRVAIVGSSGAGKTTLLRLIKGQLRPRTGAVVVMGVELASAPRAARQRVNRRTALIPQQFHLAPRLTALRNALCGRLGCTSRWQSLLGLFSQEDRILAWSALCEVGLAAKAHQRADTLSGGEQQRVAIARALAQEPAIMLADEPVASLDPARAVRALELFTAIQEHHQTTLVMSLHQPALAQRFAQRIIGLKHGQVVFDAPARSVCDAALKELYRDEPATIEPAPSPAPSAPAQAAGA